MIIREPKNFKPLPRAKVAEPSVEEGLAEHFDDYAREIL